MLIVKAILLTPFLLALYITCRIVLFPSAISFASNHWMRLFQLHCTVYWKRERNDLFVLRQAFLAKLFCAYFLWLFLLPVQKRQCSHSFFLQST